MSADAGWYPEPGSPGTLRYWDGTAWTEQRQPAQSAPQSPPAPAPGPAPGQDFTWSGPAAGAGGRPQQQVSGGWWLKPLLMAGIPAIIALVGVFLEYASDDFGNSLTGIDTDDGKLTLVLCLVGLGLLALVKFRKTTAIIQLLFGLAVAATGLVDILDLNDKDLNVGIGLWISTIAGLVWAILGILTITVRRPGRR